MVKRKNLNTRALYPEPHIQEETLSSITGFPQASFSPKRSCGTYHLLVKTTPFLDPRPRGLQKQSNPPAKAPRYSIPRPRPHGIKGNLRSGNRRTPPGRQSKQQNPKAQSRYLESGRKIGRRGLTARSFTVPQIRRSQRSGVGTGPKIRWNRRKTLAIWEQSEDSRGRKHPRTKPR